MMRIAILGFGSVGRGIARAILAKNLDITVTGLADSRSGIIDPAGIDLAAALARKENGGPPCGGPDVSPGDVVAKADYDVLVEVTPPTNVDDGEPALGHIRGGASGGKNTSSPRTKARLPLPTRNSGACRDERRLPEVRSDGLRSDPAHPRDAGGGLRATPSPGSTGSSTAPATTF